MIVCLLVLSAAVAQPRPTPPPRDVTFIGFSEKNALSAFRVTVRVPRPDHTVDSYSLVRVLQVADNHLAATFRDGAIVRRDRRGHVVPADPARLAQQNPAWLAAAPRRIWTAFARRHRFSRLQLDFGGSLVRLIADPDTALNARGDKTVLKVDGKAGAPLGYTPVIRLFEGQLLPLGHYRTDAGAADVSGRGELEVYHSRDGMCVAVISRQGTGALGRSRAAVVTTPPGNPVGSTKLGLFGMIDAQEHSAAAEFKQVWPNRAHDYDVYVSDQF